MRAYILLQMRAGDMVSMLHMYTHRVDAFQALENIIDNSTSWYKVLEIEHNALQPGLLVEVVLRVRWSTSNRVTLVGVFQPGFVPERLTFSDTHFIETLQCQ